MVERFVQGKIRWTNLKRPTTEEIKKVAKELEIPSVLLSDVGGTVPRNSVTLFEDVIKVTLDFPAVKRIGPSHQLEVKFLFTKNYLVTIQYEEMEGIDRFRRQFEIASPLRKKQTHITGAHLFVGLMSDLYESMETKIDNIEAKLGELEALIFRNNEKQMVFEISAMSKKLIAFRHVLHGHDDILKDLVSTFNESFAKVTVQDIEMLRDHFEELEHRANAQYQTLVALRETNSAMLNTKQNEIMKIFTVMAFTTFPLMLFSSMFGMNTANTPLIGHPHDFWIIVLVMIVATISFFAYFRYKNWM